MFGLNIIGNYLIITDNTTGVEYAYPKEIVKIEDYIDNVYFIFSGTKQRYKFKYTEVLDENNDPFADKQALLDWGHTNTGNTAIVITKNS